MSEIVDGRHRRPQHRLVADAVLTEVKLSGVGATVGETRALFEDEHVHSAVIVHDGVLLTVVDRPDLVGAPDDGAVVGLGRRAGRTVLPDTGLEQARAALVRSGRRRLAVVSPEGILLGLLCLNRTGRGFCSDQDVAARAASRRPAGTLAVV